MLRVLTRVGTLLSRRLASSKVATYSAPAESVSEPISRPAISLELFEDLKARIHGTGTTTVDKITVTVKEANGKKRPYAMNRHTSTPLSCAKHISAFLAKSSALAIVTYPSGTVETVSPVTRFDQSCEVEFVRFNTPDTLKASLVNQAFWRSASVLTAAILDECFPGHNAKANCEPVKSLYFSASVDNVTGDFGEVEMNSTHFFSYMFTDSLNEIQARINDLIKSPTKFDSITVPESVALEYGLETGLQLCKLNKYVCELDGPVISSPSQIGRFQLIGSTYCEKLLNIGGIALPQGQEITSYHWDLIRQAARKEFIM